MYTTHSHRSSRRNTQSGAALVVSLMMLLVMTLIGITAMNTTVLEEKMAGNNRQRQIAFQAASGALRSAEAWLAANVQTVAQFEALFDGTPDELYWERKPTPGSPLRSIPFEIYDSSAWVAGNSIPPTQSLTTGSERDPRYVVEYMGRVGEPPLDYSSPDSRKYAFRITAIGWGVDDTTSYLAQSTFRMRLL